MPIDQKTLETLVAKEDIRELVLLYSRGVDRQDFDLLRDLYTADATDTHGDTFDGSAKDYCDFLQASLPHIRYSGHHVCNHMISVDGDTGEGEVYALAYHIFPDRHGGWTEDFMCVRYIDRYAREADGKWRFAKRVVTYDMRTARPFLGTTGEEVHPTRDASYETLMTQLFGRGARG
jgi:ketosteroid isomerase-like protein